MAKKFDNIDEFLNVISGITIDGSVMIDLKGSKPKIPKEKQFPYVEEAAKMSLEQAITNLPTALRFELIKEGYEYLIDDLNFEELDDTNDWGKGRMTSYLLRKFPQHESRLDWSKLKKMWLAYVLMDQPQFANKVDFSQMDTKSYSKLISNRPEFAEKFDFSLLNNKENADNWFGILEKNPQFAEKCDWTLINDYQKKKLKELHPSIKQFTI